MNKPVVAHKPSSIPATSPRRYMTGMAPLNIPSPENTGETGIFGRFSIPLVSRTICPWPKRVSKWNLQEFGNIPIFMNLTFRTARCGPGWGGRGGARPCADQ